MGCALDIPPLIPSDSIVLIDYVTKIFSPFQGRNYSLTNRIAPRENSGAFLSSSSASAFNSAAPNGRNGLAAAAVASDGFISPYVDPGAVLDTWSDMSVETQSGPY